MSLHGLLRLTQYREGVVSNRTYLAFTARWLAMALFASMGLTLAACDEDTGDSSSGSYTSPGSSSKTYYCDCYGNGLYAGIEVTASSLSSATNTAESMCDRDYPSANCSCDCSAATGGSSSGTTGTPSASCTDECSPHFALKCDAGPGGEQGTWKCQEYWVNGDRCLEWVWKGTDYWDNACE